jgi:hypothetical protein
MSGRWPERDFVAQMRNAGLRMRLKLLATLIVCVSFLTQFGASLSGASAARDGTLGRLWCHKQISVAATAKSAPTKSVEAPLGDKSAPNGAPFSHDHGSCSFCQLGVDAPPFDANVLAPRIVGISWRTAKAETESPLPRYVFNRGAPARAPPSQA